MNFERRELIAVKALEHAKAFLIPPPLSIVLIRTDKKLLSIIERLLRFNQAGRHNGENCANKLEREGREMFVTVCIRLIKSQKRGELFYGRQSQQNFH